MKLHYEESVGSEDLFLPIVCLHAFPVYSHMYWQQVEHLSDQHRILALNFRGYGASAGSFSPDSFNVTQFALDVRDTLREIDIPRAVFVGCSMGGYVLFELWRREPELIAGMVLADTKAEADTEQERAGRYERIEKIKAEGTAGLPDSTAGMLSDKTRSERGQVEVMVRDWATQPTAETITSTLDMLAKRPDSIATLATINVPTLVLVGENDKVTPLANAQTIHEGIVGSTLQVIPAAGHLSPLERPEETNDAIRHFLKEHNL